jgi:WD40 repeat protein
MVFGGDFSPDGRTVVLAESEHTVRLFDSQSGREQWILRGHRGRVRCVCFGPDGQFLASGDEQPGEVKVWDLTRHPEYVRIQEPRGTDPEALAFDSQSRFVLYVIPKRGLCVYDLKTGQAMECPLEIQERWRTPALKANFSGDGRRLATIAQKDPFLIQTWNVVPAGGSSHQPEVRALSDLRGHAFTVYQVVMSRDGRRVASAGLGKAEGKTAREIRVWDAATGGCLFHKIVRGELQTPLYDGFLGGALALSPDGGQIAFDTYRDGSQPATGAQTAAITAEVHVVEVASGNELLCLTGHSPWISSLTFAHDGQRLASGDREGIIRVWNTKEGSPLHAAPLQGPTWQLSFSPDGTRLAGVERSAVVKLWDVDSGQELLVLRGSAPPAHDPGFNPQLAWSPDGRRLAAANYDKGLSVWDAGENYPARAIPAAQLSSKKH